MLPITGGSWWVQSTHGSGAKIQLSTRPDLPDVARENNEGDDDSHEPRTGLKAEMFARRPKGCA
jgi:hypothetical protein